MAFDFEKLEIYKKAVVFANAVYDLTKKFPKDEQFGIISQFRRAAVSVSLNLAEGSGRTSKEFKHYILMARTSIQECIPLLRISFMQGYINGEELEKYYKQCEELARMFCGLSKSI